jgi:nicotinamide riboside kinase
MSMNVSFAFSGSCHSGKTTLMSKIKDRFGTRVHVVGECIREHIHESIDAERSSALRYLRLQQRAITEKIRLEDAALRDALGKLIIIDRSLADSLYYLITHTDTRQLNSSQLAEYAELVKHVTTVARSSKRYDMLFMLQPIPVKVLDPMRPQNIVQTQCIEHAMIETLNIGLFTGLSTLTKVDVATEEDLVLQACADALFELR